MLRPRPAPRPMQAFLSLTALAAVLVAGSVLLSGLIHRDLGGAGRVVMDGRPLVAPAVPPGSDDPPRTVTLVAVPGLDVPLLHQLAAADAAWRRLLDRGAVGLMAAHTGGYYGREAGYLTLGAGARAASAPSAGWSMPADARLAAGPAWRLYQGWSGSPAARPGAPGVPAPQARDGATSLAAPAREVTGTASRPVTGAPAPGLPGLPAVLHWGWSQIIRANAELNHPVPVGALGESLHRAGLRTAALGNADLRDGPWADTRRGAPLVTGDRQGVTDFGLIDERALRPDPAFPGGWRTDWEAVLAAWERARAHAALLVIEAGDLGRLEDLAGVLDPARWQAARLEAGRDLGRALTRLLARQGPGDRVILLSPAPADDLRARGETLMPIVAWGAGPGLLATPSTRRAGVVTSTDIAPTVTAHLGAPPAPEWVGRPLTVVPAAGDGVAAVDRLNRAFVANYRRRALFIRTFVLAGLVLTAGPLLDLWRRRQRAWLRPLLALAAFPLANLLLPAWPVDGPGAWLAGPWTSLALAVGLALALAGLAHRLAPSPPAAFAGIGLWTAGVTLADALAGGWLAQLTPFGYSPIGGARFYGIGNEYMGVLIGAVAVAAAGWAEHRRPGRWRRLAVPAALAAACAALAAPTLGSNFGGALSAAVAATGPVLAAALPTRAAGGQGRGVARAGRAALLAAAAPALAAGAMILWDGSLGSASSHVMATLEQVRAVGPAALAQVVVRKLAMNLRLMRYTNWSYLFVMLVFAYAFLVYRRAAVVRALARRYPETVRGLTAVAAGSLAALVLNDSGIVAAATTLVYGVCPLLALAFHGPGPEPVPGPAPGRREVSPPLTVRPGGGGRPAGDAC